MTRDQLNGCLFIAAIGIGICRWWMMTVTEEQLSLLKSWKPVGFDS